MQIDSLLFSKDKPLLSEKFELYRPKSKLLMVSFQNIYILYEFRSQSKAKLLEKLNIYSCLSLYPFQNAPVLTLNVLLLA